MSSSVDTYHQKQIIGIQPLYKRSPTPPFTIATDLANVQLLCGVITQDIMVGNNWTSASSSPLFLVAPTVQGQAGSVEQTLAQSHHCRAAAHTHSKRGWVRASFRVMDTTVWIKGTNHLSQERSSLKYMIVQAV